MAELLNVADLEAAKKQDTFHSEVITGKTGGVAGGADIDYATNAVTGQVQKTLPKLLADIDWYYVGLFADGVTFTKRSDFAVDAVGIQWVYVGSYPFTATAGTVPSEPTYQVIHVGSLQNLTGLTEPSGLAQRHYTKTTVAEIATGVFSLGDRLEVTDRGGNKFVISSGTANTFNKLEATGGLVAEIEYPETCTIEAYGAVSGGPDCSTMFQFAIDNYGIAIARPGKTYYIANLQTSKIKSSIYCPVGRSTLRVIDGSNNGFAITHSNTTFVGVDLDGGMSSVEWFKDLTPFGARSGLIVGNPFGTGSQLNNITIKDCDIYGFDRFGLHGREVQVGFKFGKRVNYENVNVYRCYVGLAISERHEYCTFTNVNSWECREGLQESAGNNTWAACTFTWCHFNANIATGENDGHGSFAACSFNHSYNGNADSRGLVMTNIVNGMAFTGCQFWYANIDLLNCIGVDISHGEIVNSSVNVNAGGVNNISNNYTKAPLVVTLVGSTYTRFRANRIDSKTDQSASYGDYFVKADTSTFAFPIAWVSTIDTKIPYSSLTRKLWGQEAVVLHNGTVGAVSTGTNLTFDVGVKFTPSANCFAVLKLRTFRAGSPLKEYTASAKFDSGITECSLNISKEIFLRETDTYDVTLKESSGVTLSITALDLIVKSQDN